MKKSLFAAALAVAIVTTLAGCSTQPTAPVDDKSTTGTPAAGTTPGTTTSGATTPGVTGAPGAMSPLKDPNNILSKRSVYFEFDKFDVRDEYRPIVEAHAKYLRENPGTKVLIQGNADERGSREYNVGLGQRRSDSVKKMMTLLGTRESQIESVSLGEEKPVCVEHAEDCWAKNRRGDMLYSGEY